MNHIMSVDLEDYYCDLPFPEWTKYEDRVTTSTKLILKLFRKYNVSATFFTLGHIAEKHPELIEEIVSEGHEISSHGYYHNDLRKLNKIEFENELKKSIDVLRKISGEKILGFRAPFFSIDKKNLWTFEILKKYLKYDSSIFPTKTPLYGIRSAPRFFYYVSNDNPLVEDKNENFLEIPLSTLHLPVIGNIPICGGFYLRFLPYPLLKFGLEKFNKKGIPAIFYIHPKDFDTHMPKIPQYSWHYYWGLNNALLKFEKILKNFTFSSVRETFF